MLITLCYSVLTWLQSRHRNEINSWVVDCCIKEKATLVYLRDDPPIVIATRNDRSRSCSRDRETTSTSVSRSESVNSNFSTPKKEANNLGRGSNSGLPRAFHGSSHSLRQTTELCYNSASIRWQRLLWEEDKSKVIALYPLQIVDLRDWTAFIGTKILDICNTDNPDNEEDPKKFYILLEAEPGVVQRELYRKFCHFGKITAWKCGSELALILLSDLHQLIDLMHIFRLGAIILEGGWRVFRLTTVSCEGTIGTLISRPETLSSNNITTLSPGDLQRLAAGNFENRETPGSTPKASLSKETSKHDIATIQECSPEEPEDDILKTLPNWYERSPKKKSIATLSFADRQIVGRKRVGSFCSGTLNSNSKSSSLASLLLCSKSLSVDDDDRSSRANPLSPTSGTPTAKSKQKSRQSFENLIGALSPTGTFTQSNSRVQSPLTESVTSILDVVQSGKSLSAFSSPKRSIYTNSNATNAMVKRTPKRLGKPPNILVLCQDSKKRGEIAGILKAMLANDRYVIYDIRWDQLAVGGWADQTALLVLSGKIPDESHVPVLLQFLGDGGRLFAWNCDSPPFGPVGVDNIAAIKGRDGEMKESRSKCVVSFGSSSQTSSVVVSNTVWAAGKDGKGLPEKFPRIMETSDSEGYSRPLTASVYAKINGTSETAIILLDGGSLGGKAVLSRVCFEENKTEESSLALLSIILSQNLGIDCTRIKAPEYTVGYLLGDHLKIKDFLSSVPSVVQQSALTVEFIPIGSQGSKPSHERFPVRTLECPQNFSTLDYFNNLTAKELGRLVIYTDVITSAMHVFNGHTLKHGLVVVAGRQTAGKGRRNNVWLSPEGSACFSIQLNIPLDSQIGRRLPFVQHIAALAVVLAVPNHEELKLRVKWPNDVYVDTVKIGGVLVETRIDGKNAVVVSGIGVNVSNAHPTVSLNSILKDGEKMSGATLVAKCLSQLELLLDMIEDGKLSQVIDLYTDNWLHGEDDEDGGPPIVRVEVSGGSFAECKIVGIDEYGFLRVEDINSGRIFSVQPDGNSFDIANKLIAIKT